MDPAPHTDTVTDQAFHGCSLENAKVIMAEGFKLPEKSADNQYGCGVYFWLGSKSQAAWWAKRGAQRGSFIGVIRAKIAFGRNLNLLADEGQERLKRVANGLIAQKAATQVTEAAVLNFMAARGWIETALILDMPMKQPDPIFSGARSLKGPRMILCVYRVEKIAERSIVLEEAA